MMADRFVKTLVIFNWSLKSFQPFLNINCLWLHFRICFDAQKMTALTSQLRQNSNAFKCLKSHYLWNSRPLCYFYANKLLLNSSRNMSISIIYTILGIKSFTRWLIVVKGTRACTQSFCVRPPKSAKSLNYFLNSRWGCTHFWAKLSFMLLPNFGAKNQNNH